MLVRRSGVVCLLAILSGCSDPSGLLDPTAERPAGAPRLLRWANPETQRFSSIGALSGETGGGFAPGDLGLRAYTAEFWAVRGQPRSVQINYQSASDTTHPFLLLTIEDPRHVPERGELAEGDSVLITVTVDRENIAVGLAPGGLIFGHPASLRIWYGGANGDMNGDGVVDDADAAIEQRLLGMWYRVGALNPWTQIPAYQLFADKSFTSALEHFSDYAISW